MMAQARAHTARRSEDDFEVKSDDGQGADRRSGRSRARVGDEGEGDKGNMILQAQRPEARSGIGVSGRRDRGRTRVANPRTSGKG